jgi:hypothetical protein
MLGNQGIIVAPPDPVINQMLLNQDKQSLNMIQNINGVDIDDQKVSECIKCRQNPLYFILNYVYFQEIGGKRKYDRELLHEKFRRVVRSVFRYHMAILLASRQLGKSTIAAGILAWAATFFPANRLVIFNFRKDAAQENN